MLTLYENLWDILYKYYIKSFLKQLWRQVQLLSRCRSWGLERSLVTYSGSHNQHVLEPGPKPGSELLDSQTCALTSLQRGWLYLVSRAWELWFGTVDRCLPAADVRQVCWHHSFKEIWFFPEGKKPGRNGLSGSLSISLVVLVYAPLRSGLASSCVEPLPQVLIHSKCHRLCLDCRISHAPIKILRL